MALVSCPICGGQVEESAPACIHCGQRRAPIVVADPHHAAFGVYAPPTHTECEFAPVAVHKFVVMSIVTLGVYQVYWTYKCWQRIAARTSEPMSPFWRAFFAPLWGYSFLNRLAVDAKAKGVTPNWSASLLAVAYFVLSVMWRLPDPWWLVTVAAFVPFIPAVRTVQAMNATSATPEPENASYSGANKIGIVIGCFVLALVVIGMYLPDPSSPIA